MPLPGIHAERNPGAARAESRPYLPSIFLTVGAIRSAQASEFPRRHETCSLRSTLKPSAQNMKALLRLGILLAATGLAKTAAAVPITMAFEGRVGPGIPCQFECIELAELGVFSGFLTYDSQAKPTSSEQRIFNDRILSEASRYEFIGPPYGVFVDFGIAQFSADGLRISVTDSRVGGIEDQLAIRALDSSISMVWGWDDWTVLYGTDLPLSPWQLEDSAPLGPQVVINVGSHSQLYGGITRLVRVSEPPSVLLFVVGALGYLVLRLGRQTQRALVARA